MSNFIDGPAKGVTLSLSRAPVFLRVVLANGKWDALDQLSDTPRPEEEIFVYRRKTDPITAHIDGRDPKTGKRFANWMSIADYLFHHTQPDDKTLRDTEAWQAWCHSQKYPPHRRLANENYLHSVHAQASSPQRGFLQA